METQLLEERDEKENATNEMEKLRVSLALELKARTMYYEIT